MTRILVYLKEGNQMKKKFIRKSIALFLTIAIFCACGLTASAYIIEANAHYGPDGYTNSWASTRDDVSDMTASKSPVTPSDVGFYWKPTTARALPASFVSSNSRSLQIYLMERDTLSDDDYVKYYVGKFAGKYVSSITFSHEATDEDLEAGKGVELFIKQYVSRVNGDGGSYYTSLFGYYCSIE